MKQITEDFVSFEVAKLLKEKGFKEIVQSLWIGEDEYHYISTESIKPDDYNSGGTCLYSAPTQSLALKWLREVHNIYIDILTYTTGKNTQFRWVGYDKGRLFSQEEGKTIYFNSYEEAVEAACSYVLKNLI